MKADNKKIGESAVNHLEIPFNGVTNVLTHFAKNDTGVCVDGFIEVYSGTAMTKESLLGEIPVQIKGTTSKVAGRDGVKRKMDIVDLEKYLDVYAGVLYFVVFMDSKLSLKEIYYKQYLPFDIRKALKERKHAGQKTITDKFRPLPKDPVQLQRLCIEFVSDYRKQRGTDVVGFLTPSEARDEEIKFETIEFTKTLYPGEMPTSLKPFETGAYLYGTTSAGKRYVLDRIPPLDSIQSSSTHVVKAGDFECECQVAIGEDRKGDFLKIGGITLRLDDVCTFTYDDVGSFRARLRDAKLFKGFVESGEIYFDGEFFGRKDTVNNVDHDELERRIHAYGRIVGLMERLGVIADWNPEDFDQAGERRLSQLYAAFVEGVHVSVGAQKENLIVFNCDIAGTRIKVLGKLDENGRYELYDLTSSSLIFATCLEGQERLDDENPMPTLFSFTEEDYRLLANITRGKLIESLSRSPIKTGNADFINNKLLEMLNAYDKGAVCSDELLSCCDTVTKTLFELDPHSEVYAINRAQTLYRMHKLDAEWLGRIRALEASTSSIEARASYRILLGEAVLAQSCIELLDDAARARFATWPIYNLLQKA